MKLRCTRAVLRLSLLGKQGADVSRELTCNVLCVCTLVISLWEPGCYCRLYKISDTMLKVQIKWRHGLYTYIIGIGWTRIPHVWTWTNVWTWVLHLVNKHIRPSTMSKWQIAFQTCQWKITHTSVEIKNTDLRYICNQSLFSNHHYMHALCIKLINDLSILLLLIKYFINWRVNKNDIN